MKKALFFLFLSLSFMVNATHILKNEQSKGLNVELSKADDSNIQQPKIDMPKIDEPKIDEPKIDMPKIDMPQIDVPKIEQPEIDMPKIEAPEIEKPTMTPTKKAKPKKAHKKDSSTDQQQDQTQKAGVPTPNTEDSSRGWKSFFKWKKSETKEDNKPQSQDPIEWYHDYDKTFAVAKKKDLPLFLFFSGTDWCPWCKKLEKNVLSNPEFYQGLTDQYVFCMVDFPMKNSIDEQQLKRNKALMQEYEVIGFPTIAIVDVEKGLIAKIGYLTISPLEYREYVLEVTETFYSSDNALDDPKNLSEGDWERLSMNAKRLGSPYFQKKLEEKGIKSCPSPFFLVEKYEKLLKEKGIDSKEAIVLKERIKQADPNNIYKSHYKLALLEFHTLGKIKKVSPDKAIQPLLEYISKFGNKTPDLWKVHFMIAHFLFSKNEVKEALIHAKLSFKLAPEKIRKELAETIGSFREK